MLAHKVIYDYNYSRKTSAHMAFIIFFDDLQEGAWFKALNQAFKIIELLPITANASNPLIVRVITYDRPDIILTVESIPLLVI